MNREALLRELEAAAEDYRKSTARLMRLLYEWDQAKGWSPEFRSFSAWAKSDALPLARGTIQILRGLDPKVGLTVEDAKTVIEYLRAP